MELNTVGVDKKIYSYINFLQKPASFFIGINIARM